MYKYVNVLKERTRATVIKQRTLSGAYLPTHFSNNDEHSPSPSFTQAMLASHHRRRAARHISNCVRDAQKSEPLAAGKCAARHLSKTSRGFAGALA